MIHRVAQAGFESDPERYDRGRPGYPAAAVEQILAFADLAPEDPVLDVAAGTGKLTRMISASNPVVAIEPVEAMRTFLARNAPGVSVVGGVAEALPLASGSFRLITVAQAFHWFDSTRAWEEFARLVPPGGTVALIWNARDRSVPWVNDVWSIMDRVEKRAPWRNHDARTRFDTSGAFVSPVEHTYWHDTPVDEQAVIDRVASVSHVAVLAEPEQGAVINEIRHVVARQGPGPLSIRYRTDLYLFERA